MGDNAIFSNWCGFACIALFAGLVLALLLFSHYVPHAQSQPSNWQPWIRYFGDLRPHITVIVNKSNLTSDYNQTQPPTPIELNATNKSGSYYVPFYASSIDNSGNYVEPQCYIKNWRIPINTKVNFTFGDSAVGCTASDVADGRYTNELNFTVNVADHSKPIVNTTNINVTATKWSEAFVEYNNNVSATDNVDGTINPTCTPHSNSIFPLGNTTVICTAKDRANNTSDRTPLYVYLSDPIQIKSHPVIDRNEFRLSKDGKDLPPIKYEVVGGNFRNITWNEDSATLHVAIIPILDGNLRIQIPRSVTDSKKQCIDGNFTVLENGDFVPHVDKTRNIYYTMARTLKIPFHNNTYEITIIGTPGAEELAGQPIPPSGPTQPNTRFLMNLTSGDRTVYERKASLRLVYDDKDHALAVGWGDIAIPIRGNISAIPQNTSLVDKIVSINATQNGTLIYNTLAKTDCYGKFRANFYSPSAGTINVAAELTRHAKNQTAGSEISVVVTEAWMPVILLAIFITGAIASVAIFLSLYTLDVSFCFRCKLRKPDKAWLYVGTIPTAVLTLFAYIILYKFPPADAAATNTIAAALITPLAAEIFASLKPPPKDKEKEKKKEEEKKKEDGEGNADKSCTEKDGK